MGLRIIGALAVATVFVAVACGGGSQAGPSWAQQQKASREFFDRATDHAVEQAIIELEKGIDEMEALARLVDGAEESYGERFADRIRRTAAVMRDGGGSPELRGEAERLREIAQNRYLDSSRFLHLFASPNELRRLIEIYVPTSIRDEVAAAAGLIRMDNHFKKAEEWLEAARHARDSR